MTDTRSWLDITLEEEAEKEEAERVKLEIEEAERVKLELEKENRAKFTALLSPLKEADPAEEKREEREHRPRGLGPLKRRLGPRNNEKKPPLESRLGPRNDQKTALESRLGPRNDVTMESPDRPRAPVFSRRGRRNQTPDRSICDQTMASPDLASARSPVFSRRGRRNQAPDLSNCDQTMASPDQAAARSPTFSRRGRRNQTPNRQTNFKREQDEVASPLAEANKRHKMGTPDSTTRGGKPSETPENRKGAGPSGTPRSDSRLLKNRKPSKDLIGKALFPRERRTSETSVVPERELTERQKETRTKQIIYGKVTVGYQNYKQLVPKALRKKKDPRTPNKNSAYSTRCWSGLIKSWRLALHQWDDPVDGLRARAQYSGNNADLKARGLIDQNGELVMFTPATIDDVITTEEKVSGGEEEENSPPETLPKTESEDVVIRRADVPLFTFAAEQPGEGDDEYAMLVTGEDLPEEDDPADSTYHLSQDSMTQEEEEEEEEEELLRMETDEMPSLIY